MKYLFVSRKIDEAVKLKDALSAMRNVKRKDFAQESIDRFFSEASELPGAELSRNGYRLYLPITLSDEVLDSIDDNTGELEKEVRKHVDDKGFQVVSYKRNRAKPKDPHNKHEIKITKVISDNPELMQRYNADPRRDLSSQNNEKLIVFCQHPYDIVGISSGRRWTSCMDIYGEDSSLNGRIYTAMDITYGTIVAYLINSDDRNIEDPLSRISIKPRLLDNKKIIYQPETSIYGNRIIEFLDKVEWVCNEIYGYERGIIQNMQDVYDDIYNNVRPRKRLLNMSYDEAIITDDNISDVVSGAIDELGNNADLNMLDVSRVTDMSFLFSGSKFNGDISKWDVSNVENMDSMFEGSFFNGDISNWNVENVTNMNAMFMDSSFNQDISKWNVSNVDNMTDMFFGSDMSYRLEAWGDKVKSPCTYRMFNPENTRVIPSWCNVEEKKVSYLINKLRKIQEP